MANLGCLLVCKFGNFLVPVLVAAHTVKNLDLRDEQGPENPTMPFVRCNHRHTLTRPKKGGGGVNKISDLFKKFWYIIWEVCKAEKEEEPAAAKIQQQDDDKQYHIVAIRLVYERKRVREYIIEKLEMCRMSCKACTEF